MADLKQISFSSEIKQIAEEMIQRFGFSESLSAIKFGFAYAIKNHREEISEENDGSLEYKHVVWIIALVLFLMMKSRTSLKFYTQKSRSHSAFSELHVFLG